MWNNSEDDITLWARDISRAIDSSDGPSLAFHLRARNDRLINTMFIGYTEDSIEQLCSNHFSKYNYSFGDAMCHLLTEYLKIYFSLSSGDIQWDQVLKRAFRLLDLWMDIYLNSELRNYHWLVPALHSMCNFINRIGTFADRANMAAGGVHETDDDEGKDKYMKQVLSNVRSKMGRVRGDDTRHSALRGPLINYRYYLGKLHMQKEEYHVAYSRVLDCCSLRPWKNTSDAIIGKVQVSILNLLYSRLMHYYDIVETIKIGDGTYSEILTREGTILCVEQLKYLVYRTLIRKV
ncbi:hypothetical protein BdWA1_001865 [Babesia duncani]|uniref:Uncharacterized protein n=1 Tax=Babesia duncani TaxID=323732 RepID=A0AAD9UP82_9APIC|nr:hypothetical protein BdWA1_001865 [Babesia duncani]